MPGGLSFDRHLPLLVLISIFLSRILAVVIWRDPGIDQAALMSNVPLSSISDFFRPLPLFEQITSLGSLIQLDITSRIFGAEGYARFFAVRAVAAMAACLAYFIFYRLMRPCFSGLEIALVLALIAAPKEVLLFTTNPKHYVYELLAACLLLLTARRYLDLPDRKHAGLFLTVVFATAVFAISAPLIVVVIGCGMLSEILFGENSEANPKPGIDKRLTRLAVLGLASILITLVFYLGYTRPAAIYQTAAYAYEYQEGLLRLSHPLSAENLTALAGAARVFHEIVEPAYLIPVLVELKILKFLPIIHLATIVITLIGLSEYWRRSRLLAGGMIGGILVIFSLNAVGALPIISMRHFMFFAPFVVPSFVLGLLVMLKSGLRMLRLPFLFVPIATAICLMVALSSVKRSEDLRSTEISAHIEKIETYPAPLWIYYGAQPSLRALRPDILNRADPAIFGLISHESSFSPWGENARADQETALVSEAFMARTAQELAGTGPVWMLFANHWPERRTPEGLQPFFDLAEADGRHCRATSGVNSVLALCSSSGIPAELADTFE